MFHLHSPCITKESFLLEVAPIGGAAIFLSLEEIGRFDIWDNI